MAGTGDRPQFRQDLLAESIDEGGAQFIDVMDDATGTAYRFYEVEYALACAMDGERDVDAIIDWADRELGLRPREREVELLASTLGALGFLSRAGAVVAEPSVHTRSTAPAMAAVTVDDELVPGVVHATAPASTIVVEDVELGQVERAKAASTPPLSAGDDVELGAPGATSKPVRDNIVVEDVPLGASGPGRERSEVSIKLTDHLALDVADVKEAVRQSQVMKAVEIEAAEATETAKAAAKQPAPVAVTPVAVKVEPPKPIEAAKPAAKEAARELATPTEAPPTVTRPRVRKELILVAAIVAIAAGIVVVLKQRQDKEPRPTAGEVDKAANDKAAADRAAMERAAADKAAADKAAAEQAAAAKNVAAEATTDPAAEQAAADKAAAEKAAADKAAAAQAATDKATADKAAADQKAAAEKAAAEKAAAEKATAAAEKAAAEKAAAEKAAAEKATAAAEKAAAEKAAAEKAAADKAAAEKAAADKAPDDAAKQEAARKARAKARAAAEAREKAELEKLLEKQRKALEERKKAEGQPPAQ